MLLSRLSIDHLISVLRRITTELPQGLFGSCWEVSEVYNYLRVFPKLWFSPHPCGLVCLSTVTTGAYLYNKYKVYVIDRLESNYRSVSTPWLANICSFPRLSQYLLLGPQLPTSLPVIESENSTESDLRQRDLGSKEGIDSTHVKSEESWSLSLKKKWRCLKNQPSQ